MSIASHISVPARTPKANSVGPVMVSFGRGQSAPLSECQQYHASLGNLGVLILAALTFGPSKHYVLGDQGTIERYSQKNLELSDINEFGVGSTELYPLDRHSDESELTLASNVWVSGYTVDGGGYVNGIADYCGYVNALIPGLGLGVRVVANGSAEKGERKRAIVLDIQGGLKGGANALRIIERCDWALKQIEASGLVAPEIVTAAIEIARKRALEAIHGPAPAADESDASETADESPSQESSESPAQAEVADEPRRGRRAS